MGFGGVRTEPRIERELRDGTCAIRLFYDGKEVSGLWVHDLWVRIGEAYVRMGGIGGVHTEEPYRMRGFARRVMEESIEYMREAGFVLSALFGIPFFYERWGFVPALPEYRISLRLEAISDAKQKHEVVDYEEGYRGHVIEIYNANNRWRTCSCLRSMDTWKGFAQGTGFGVGSDVKVILGRDGSPSGYLSFDATLERTAVSEVGYTDIDVFETMVALIARRAEEREHKEIYLTMPPDHPFAIYLRRYGCIVTEQFTKSGGGMMRIIDVEGLFAKISPELSRRLRGSPLQSFSGMLSIETEIGEVGLEIDSGDVRVGEKGKAKLKLPQGKLTQLVVGYRDVMTIALEEDVSIPSEFLPLLEVLFPLGHPYIWWCDRF
jgi:predicted acetyltransferase